MGRLLYLWCLAALLILSGCSTTGTSQNRGVAPPIPTPSPSGPGQVAPPPGAVIAPPPGAPANAIPLPPGSSPAVGMAPMVSPSSPEQARVNATAAKLYQCNSWMTARPQWIVSPQDSPGLTTQGDQCAIISAALVRASSDGQLAAAMSLQLGDILAYRQQLAMNSARNQRQIGPAPDYFQMSQGTSSTLALLDLDEVAKNRYDPRDLRRKEKQQQTPAVDPNAYARQMLVQAGYSELELNQVAPLLQQYPMVRPAGR